MKSNDERVLWAPSRRIHHLSRSTSTASTKGKEICGGEEDGGKDDVFSRRSLMVPQVNFFSSVGGTMTAPVLSFFPIDLLLNLGNVFWK